MLKPTICAMSKSRGGFAGKRQAGPRGTWYCKTGSRGDDVRTGGDQFLGARVADPPVPSPRNASPPPRAAAEAAPTGARRIGGLAERRDDLAGFVIDPR